MQPNRNAIGDTIYRTTEHGDSYRYRSRVRRAPRAGSQENHEQAPQGHPRLHPTHKQCTLKPEEPPNGGISKDFSRNFTPNRFQTGRLSRFGVKCRLFGGERGWRAHQRQPIPAKPWL
ncbi:hypothetical protein CIP100629_02035 [Corynebacterium diphtheriae]|nr:hypothetical protein CIP103987_01813 [Corynebacterium diphtheriae]CAB0523855.1 hypothetical protein CIP100629_02035 [Corynebacterium diphtheriae]CAB0525186.1 hypothetical protein CIP107506_02054 [Corynebacterium diphtheriae]CAB0566548.1 hypothetical protein CIP107526_01869 [Corynebacterium diphtheriae]CAB0734398.1 hypothetical protein FRC0089_01894 [Corynebacterium diphtheriae]